jgi:hypothetical protein
MELTAKSFFLTLKEEVQIGELKATLVAQVMGNKKEFDIEFTDWDDMSYMGHPIEGYTNWTKFADFHQQMGIDFRKMVDDKFNEIFTKEAVSEFVEKVKF